MLSQKRRQEGGREGEGRGRESGGERRRREKGGREGGRERQMGERVWHLLGWFASATEDMMVRSDFANSSTAAQSNRAPPRAAGR